MKLEIMLLLNLMLFYINKQSTIKPVLRGHLWDQEKVAQ